ncbi:hypothetical protein JCM16814_00050 [Desulfobaculum senezii]
MGRQLRNMFGFRLVGQPPGAGARHGQGKAAVGVQGISQEAQGDCFRLSLMPLITLDKGSAIRIKDHQLNTDRPDIQPAPTLRPQCRFVIFRAL